MRKLSPHLWYDKEAKEAATFYTEAFANARIKNTIAIHDTPSGSVDIVDMEIEGLDFSLISAGPLFRFNPAVSFQVAVKTKDEAAALWGRLSAGGSALMEFGAYPFSEAFGWTADRYGLSWQVMYQGDRPIRQVVTPMLMFVGAQCGKAEEAIRFYASVFRDSAVGDIMRYGAGGPDAESTVQLAAFTLEGTDFAAMDSALSHNFAFNEAISFVVRCANQREIDYYWARLSADPKAEQCGWLKDRFGVSWQVVPAAMDAMMASGDRAAISRVTQAFLAMKKFDLAALEKAYQGG
jgi:predicted 3-demethylubiquinone-9 3-methyltransferase (glyoxalase superfamily)